MSPAGSTYTCTAPVRYSLAVCDEHWTYFLLLLLSTVGRIMKSVFFHSFIFLLLTFFSLSNSLRAQDDGRNPYFFRDFVQPEYRTAYPALPYHTRCYKVCTPMYPIPISTPLGPPIGPIPAPHPVYPPVVPTRPKQYIHVGYSFLPQYGIVVPQYLIVD
jgi:hypothetical protein